MLPRSACTSASAQLTPEIQRGEISTFLPGSQLRVSTLELA
jgi:hypothetical protein